MKIFRFLFVLIFLVDLIFFPKHLFADAWEFNPTVGWRFGGHLVEKMTGDTIEIEPSPAFGFTLGRSFNYATQQAEFVYSRQESEIDFSDGTDDDSVDVVVEQYYFGLTQLYQVWGNDKFRPFLEGLVGATNFNPTGFESHVFFSLGAIGGFKYFATKMLGFRLDGRVYTTFTDGSTAIVCSGGCVVNYTGSPTWQGEITPSVFLQF